MCVWLVPAYGDAAACQVSAMHVRCCMKLWLCKLHACKLVLTSMPDYLAGLQQAL